MSEARTLPLDPDNEAVNELRVAWLLAKIREALTASRPRGRRELDVRVVAVGGLLTAETTVGHKEHPP